MKLRALLMNKALLLATVFACTVLGLSAATTPAAPGAAVPASADITLAGTFNWSGDKSGDHALKAVLTPSGTNEWTAVFTFTWGKDPHTYSGTIKGNLANGTVTGEGENEGGNRTFKFTGRATNRVLKLTHTETTGGKNTPTGSATLKPATAKTPTR